MRIATYNTQEAKCSSDFEKTIKRYFKKIQNGGDLADGVSCIFYVFLHIFGCSQPILTYATPFWKALPIFPDKI
jgi:hypothetical protein